eukprot:g3345.t1
MNSKGGSEVLKGNYAWKNTRRDLLIGVFKRVRPHALIVEMYPFGRRQFKYELKPLLNAAHAMGPSERPAILCSLRDILVATKDPNKHGDMADVFEAYFDQLLVHGDPDFISLDHTLTSFAKIPTHKIAYTGYVVPVRDMELSIKESPTVPLRSSESVSTVLVSVGSGHTGSPSAFFDAALHTRDLLPKTSRAFRAQRWRFICGPCASMDFVRALRQRASLAAAAAEDDDDDAARIISVEASVEGGLIESGALDPKCCVLSLSMGGYNTVSECVVSGVPMVIVPFVSEYDEEQLLRARRLSRVYSLAKVVTAQSAEPGSMAKAIASAIVQVETAWNRPPPTLTVVLLNYKRPDNLRRIIRSLRRQTVAPEIFLWNNSGAPFRADGVTWQIDTSENKFCWPRWFMASLAKTSFVCVMDDDLVPKDDRVLEDMCAYLSESVSSPNTIIGPFGMILDPKRPYAEGTHVNVHHFPWHKMDGGLRDDSRVLIDEDSARAMALSVDLIKGRMMMMRRDALQRKLGFVFDHTDIRGDDIAVSGSLSDGQRGVHRIPRLLHRRLLELPAPHALCSSGGHYSHRERVRQRFFKKASELATG